MREGRTQMGAEGEGEVGGHRDREMEGGERVTHTDCVGEREREREREREGGGGPQSDTSLKKGSKRAVHNVTTDQTVTQWLVTSANFRMCCVRDFLSPASLAVTRLHKLVQTTHWCSPGCGGSLHSTNYDTSFSSRLLIRPSQCLSKVSDNKQSSYRYVHAQQTSQTHWCGFGF